MKTKRLVMMGILSSMALVIFVAEAQIPVIIPIPGIKLGLANVITLVSMSLLGRRDAACILAVRVTLGSVFTGSASAFIFSAAGGVLAYAAMALTIRRFPEKMLWVVSILGAVAHIAGQLAAALYITAAPGIFYYGLILIPAAIVTGAFTGLCAGYLIRPLRRLLDNR